MVHWRTTFSFLRWLTVSRTEWRVGKLEDFSRQLRPVEWMKGGLIPWPSTCLTPASFDYILTPSSDSPSRNPPPLPTTLWATTSRTIRTASAPILTRLRRSSLFYYFWRRQLTCVDSTANPLRYSSIKTLNEVHSTSSHISTDSRLTLFVTDIGEV